MKKYTSAALLALQLTWKAALAVFLVSGAIQTFALWREMMPGGVALQVTFCFERMLSYGTELAGRFYFAMLMLALVFTAGYSKGSKTVYTMNRLGLPEKHVDLVFGLVFSGYFFLYWAFCLALCYAYFVWYSHLAIASSNAWMLACWRSEWLHTLLPLGEWLGYVRNMVLCLGFGFCAAFGAHMRRRGQNALACLLPGLLGMVLVNGRPASTSQHIGLIILLTALAVGWYLLIRGGDDNENDL